MKSIYIILLSIITSSISAQQIGLQLYSLRYQFDENTDSTYQLIEDLGIKILEGGGWENQGYSTEEYNKLLDKHNFDMVSVGGSFEELRDEPMKVVERAKAVSASYAVCFWIPHHPDTNFTIDHINEALEVFNTAGKLLKENGIQLCYHPHGYEFKPYQDGTLIDPLIKGSDYFQFEMDVFWVKNAGMDPVELLNKYPEEFLMFHLKDRACNTPYNHLGRAPLECSVVLGEGSASIEELIKDARKHGHFKYMFIEDESPEVMKQLPKSIEFLKRLGFE